MALRFILCTFLIGLAHVIPTTFGKLWGVDVYYHKHGLTPEEIQKIGEHNQKNHQNHIDSLHASQEQSASLTNALFTEVVGNILNGTAKINDLQADVGSMVTEFINKHVVIMANNTAAHHNQTIILQKQMNNLVIDFITKHQDATRKLIAGHQNDTAYNQERNRKWMEDFRKASTEQTALTNALFNEVVGNILNGTAKINDLQADVSSMVTEFINKHEDMIADRTAAHQNQTSILQKQMNNLIIDFVTKHQNVTAHNQETNRKWMEDFRNAFTDAQKAYNKMINHQMDFHGNMTLGFVARSNEIFERDGKLFYFAGVGVGVLFLMGVVGIVWKGLFGKCGKKVERYQPNMFAAHPSTYPPPYGRPGYEMVPMVRADLEADRK